jgi:hypothetical protein
MEDKNVKILAKGVIPLFLIHATNLGIKFLTVSLYFFLSIFDIY